MIIYRITGRREAFKNTGMLAMEPESDSSKANILKLAKKMSADLDTKSLKHTLVVKKLTLKPFDQALALVMFGKGGAVEDLIESSETIGAFASKDQTGPRLVMPAVSINEPVKAELDEETQKYANDLPF